MKVKVKDLVPNPYRNMEKYPIDPYKVEALKNSIGELEFWDNLLAREKDGKYEIAYGHHRLIALQELGIEEVEIPVRKLDDSTMIQIMANENMDQWKLLPSIVLQTVEIARDFLNAELRKYESWEECPRSLINLLSLDGRHTFEDLKSKGVGQTTLLKFLGRNWVQSRIQFALETLDAEDVSRKAIETFKIVSTAREFKKAIKEVAKEESIPISKKKQEEVAEGVQKRIENHKGLGGGKSHRSSMKTMVRQELTGESKRPAELKNLEVEIENAMQKSRGLTNAILGLNEKLSIWGVNEIKGLNAFLALDNLTDLLGAVRKLLTYFGYDYKNLLIGGSRDEE